MPIITKENHCDIDSFIKDNLSEFNRDSKAFEFNRIKDEYKKLGYASDNENIITATKIRKRLNENYRKLIEDPNKKDKLEDDLKQLKASAVYRPPKVRPKSNDWRSVFLCPDIVLSLRKRL